MSCWNRLRGPANIVVFEEARTVSTLGGSLKKLQPTLLIGIYHKARAACSEHSNNDGTENEREARVSARSRWWAVICRPFPGGNAVCAICKRELVEAIQERFQDQGQVRPFKNWSMGRSGEGELCIQVTLRAGELADPGKVSTIYILGSHPYFANPLDTCGQDTPKTLPIFTSYWSFWSRMLKYGNTFQHGVRAQITK